MALVEQKTVGKSTIIKDLCPKCGKIAIETKHEQFPEYRIAYLKCGHAIFTDSKVKADNKYEILSTDGKTLYPYQVDGVKFLEQANGKALIADEMGVGKTVQTLAYLKLHPECLPALIVCKSSVTTQWLKEVLRWCGKEYYPLLLQRGTDRPLEGFPIYIISFDLIRRITGKQRKKQTNVLFGLESWNSEQHANPLADFPFKTVIIDETQQIKNPNSARTQELRKIVMKRENVIGLSGTPAKNNAAEMFSILNMINPTRFPVLKNFMTKFCDMYWTGYGYKAAGIRDLEYFKQYTSDIMIRRERKDVLPELPDVTRRFVDVNVENKSIQDAYDDAVDEFNEEYDEFEDGKKSMQNVIAKMARLRHLAGLAKVQNATERAKEFLISTDRKLVFFTHHQDVAHLLENNLNAWIGEEDNEEETSAPKGIESVINCVGIAGARRDALIEEFRNNPNKRVMILSTLASGEGLNLQFVSDMILLERQWNPANEEQAEARFPRPGQKATFINAEYMIATSTIDEYFTELVEKKREWIASIHKETEYSWDESSLMKDLADTLRVKGKTKWKLN